MCEPPAPRARPWVALLLLLAVVLLGRLAITSNLPWLVSENRRIEPWKWPLVWSSEIVATVAFLRYVLAAILPAGWRPAAGSRRTARAFLIGLGLDLGFSLYEVAAQRWSYWWAVPVQAQVVSGHSFEQSLGHRRYSFSCVFLDQAGQRRDAWFTMLERDLTRPIIAGIDGGRLPVPIKLLHDPSWPDRSWIAETPYTDDDRVYVYSLLSLLFSGLITAQLAASRLLFGLRGLPPPETGPLFGGIAILSVVGLLQGW